MTLREHAHTAATVIVAGCCLAVVTIGSMIAVNAHLDQHAHELRGHVHVEGWVTAEDATATAAALKKANQEMESIR